MPAVALLAAATLAFGADPHAPLLVHDAAESSPASRVEAFPYRVPGRASWRRSSGAVAYRRIAGRYRQYWLFYADNPQDRGILRTGRHAGDWELFQLRLDARGRPEEVVVGQHSGAERCGWNEVTRRDGHPVVWVANGSHASYLRPGVRDRTFPDPNDEADGRGVVLRPAVQPVSASEPAWMRWPGRWGATRARPIPYESSSPRGPAFQPDRWDDPATFARSARGCRARCDEEDECDRRETALAGFGLAGIVVAALGVAWRRERNVN